MKYRKRNWKYEVLETVCVQTKLRPGRDIHVTNFISLLSSGVLIIDKGYAWDGVTWGIDFESCMRASLVHDALYQLMGERLLSLANKPLADETFKQLMLEDNTPLPVVWLYYTAVTKLGKEFVKP